MCLCHSFEHQACFYGARCEGRLECPSPTKAVPLMLHLLAEGGVRSSFVLRKDSLLSVVCKKWDTTKDIKQDNFETVVLFEGGGEVDDKAGALVGFTIRHGFSKSGSSLVGE